MQRDYPELEGLKVFYFSDNNREYLIGKVVGCNIDVGVTIMEYGRKDEYLLCWRGKLAPQMKGEPYSEINNEIINWLIRSIKNRVINVDNLRKLVQNIGYGTDPSEEHCAFTQ